MGTLHITPSDSAAGSLMKAMRDAGRKDEVLAYRDDLSCGPIASDDPAMRAAWWARFYQTLEVEDFLRGFWNRVAAADDRLVLWFGRHSARELAFVLAWADRIGDRSYDIIDVTGLRLPFTRRDGSATVTQPAQSVALVPSDGLRTLLGGERPITIDERDENRRHWRRLKVEGAPFRIVTASGLVSAPIDHFDSVLMERTTTEWRKVARVIGDTMGHNSDPYYQVGDVMLLTRLVALIEAGKLLVDGDPWEMHSSRVRLPG